jgi:excinuclease ABC subunit A
LEVGGNVANIEDLESFGFVPEEKWKNLVIDFLMKTTNNFFKDWQILFKWRFMKDTELVLKEIETGNVKEFSNKFELDGIILTNRSFFQFQ